MYEYIPKCLMILCGGKNHGPKEKISMFEFLEPINNLPGKRTFINVINLRILGWGISLNCPEESSMITAILIDERGKQEDQYQSEEAENALTGHCCLWRWRKRPGPKECRATEPRKAERTNCALQPVEGTQPYHIPISPVGLFHQTSDLQNCKV